MSRTELVGTMIALIGFFIWVYAAYHRMSHAFDVQFRACASISMVTLMIGTTVVATDRRAAWRDMPDKQVRRSALGVLVGLGWVGVSAVLYFAIRG
jgi:hypothetical protein